MEINEQKLGDVLAQAYRRGYVDGKEAVQTATIPPPTMPSHLMDALFNTLGVVPEGPPLPIPGQTDLEDQIEQVAAEQAGQGDEEGQQTFGGDPAFEERLKKQGDSAGARKAFEEWADQQPGLVCAGVEVPYDDGTAKGGLRRAYMLGYDDEHLLVMVITASEKNLHRTMGGYSLNDAQVDALVQYAASHGVPFMIAAWDGVRLGANTYEEYLSRKQEPPDKKPGVSFVVRANWHPIQEVFDGYGAG